VIARLAQFDDRVLNQLVVHEGGTTAAGGLSQDGNPPPRAVMRIAAQ
jgi:hypothetical protein